MNKNPSNQHSHYQDPKQQEADLAAEKAHAEKAEKSYIPQDIALEMCKALEAAGMGQPGTPNTVWSMVHEVVDRYHNALAELAASRASYQAAFDTANLRFAEIERIKAELEQVRRELDNARSATPDDPRDQLAATRESLREHMATEQGLRAELTRWKERAEKAEVKAGYADSLEVQVKCAHEHWDVLAAQRDAARSQVATLAGLLKEIRNELVDGGDYDAPVWVYIMISRIDAVLKDVQS